MSTDEYVPEEDDVRMAYIEAHVSMADPITRHQRAQAEREAEDAWTAFLARVRRDAARDALVEFRRTELALIPPDADEDDPIRTRQQALAWRIEMHLLGNHPEEVSP